MRAEQAGFLADHRRAILLRGKRGRGVGELCRHAGHDRGLGERARVSVGTIEWMVSNPAMRPECGAHDAADVREVFCSVRRYASLLGCDDKAVRYRVSRGVLELNEFGQLGMQNSDLKWGLRYFDAGIEPPTDFNDAVLSTCFLPTVERELVRSSAAQ